MRNQENHQIQKTYRPEVVNQHIEHTQQNHQENSTPLGLETHNNHDASTQTEQADNNTPQAPLAGEDESNKKEDQQHTTSKLDVHLAILLVQLGQSGGDELLANPRVGQNHKQTTDNTQVAEEEVEIENETVSETLRDNDTEQTGDTELGVLAGDDEEGTYRHGNDVWDEERVRDTPGN